MARKTGKAKIIDTAEYDELTPAQKAAVTKAMRYNHRVLFDKPELAVKLTPEQMHERLSDGAKRAWVKIRKNAANKARGNRKANVDKAVNDSINAEPEPEPMA